MSRNPSSQIDYGETFHRQLDVLKPRDLRHPIHIVGAGAVGSTIALALTKMGFGQIEVYDFDKVEIHNVPNQIYGRKDVGNYKVDALDELIERYAPVTLKAIHRERFELIAKPNINSLYVSAVDSLDARKSIWKHIRDSGAWYIDTRMGLEQGSITLSDVFSKKEYEETLNITPSEAPCTARSIMFTPFVMAGYVGWLIKEIARKSKDIKPYKSWLLGIGGMSIVEVNHEA